ncbi:hypothetical protein HDR61_02995 [bacterium]|nr:hypothetical protein [bacterium]
MINIHTSRVFIPYPTGWTRKCRTFGIKALGYNKFRYGFQRELGNRDDVADMKDFYDFISVHYDMDLSQMPQVVPFVKYVDFMRSRGGIAATDSDAIKQLKKDCNTLIITDEDEREYVEELYLNILRRDIGLFQFQPSKIPPRFMQKVR